MHMGWAHFQDLCVNPMERAVAVAVAVASLGGGKVTPGIHKGVQVCGDGKGRNN